MKKLVLLALAAVMMAGCSIEGKDVSSLYNTCIIDSCEYVDGMYRLAHKGNCRFCAERRKQELKELVEQLKENK